MPQGLHLVPFRSDLLDALAALMLEQHRAALPDLSRAAVLFPSPHAIPRFRRLLLERAEQLGYRALLPPWMGTLDGWLRLHSADATVEQADRELLLFDALAPYSTLRERYGTWPLIQTLLALFDELNAHRQLPIPESDELLQLLAQGYGTGSDFEPLKAEAGLVHQLWTAWNTHLVSHGLIDAGLHRLAALSAALNVGQTNTQAHLYIVGIAKTTRSEAEWLKSLFQQERLTLMVHDGHAGWGSLESPLTQLLQRLDIPCPAEPRAEDTYTRFINRAFAIDAPLTVRARTFANDVAQSPAVERLRYFEAANFEQEARAVELSIRRWIAGGIRDIGFVTQDRKLARRVRALLERANIPLRDTAGWALSTTSAATTVMRWLECVEQDFPYAALLDLLKSPFLTLGFDQPELDRLLAVFERVIIRRYNITGGLQRYRQMLETLDTMLRAQYPHAVVGIGQLCERLAHAAEPLIRAQKEKPKTAAEYLERLRDSIRRLGLSEGLETDDAGRQLLEALAHPRRLPPSIGAPRMSWKEFTAWWVRELERQRFRPSPANTGVELLGLSDSRCLHFQALIVAGCNRDHIPGAIAASPFFNDGVRQRLGLPTRADHLSESYYDFRRLLEAAPQVLLTRRHSENGEAQVASPWVEQLMAFHRLAYRQPLTDPTLSLLLNAPATELYHRDAPLPAPARPATARLPKALMPTTYTASSHQRMLDCPYQFFALDGLRLRPLDPLRDEMEKLDYGKLIHRALQAFHGGVAGLPGPWSDGPIDDSNQAQAAELLRAIGHAVFRTATDTRLSTRGWRHRWDEFVPTYLAWQAARDRHWRIESTETPLEREIEVGSKRITLNGRADRIERSAEGLAIVDYKTGQIPDEETVIAGEHVQLPFYALLAASPVTEVGYVYLDNKGIKESAIGGAELTALAAACEARLHRLIEALQQESELPAWGDITTCRYCEYEGLCRKEMWET